MKTGVAGSVGFGRWYDTPAITTSTLDTGGRCSGEPTPEGVAAEDSGGDPDAMIRGPEGFGFFVVVTVTKLVPPLAAVLVTVTTKDVPFRDTTDLSVREFDGARSLRLDDGRRCKEGDARVVLLLLGALGVRNKGPETVDRALTEARLDASLSEEIADDEAAGEEVADREAAEGEAFDEAAFDDEVFVDEAAVAAVGKRNEGELLRLLLDEKEALRKEEAPE